MSAKAAAATIPQQTQKLPSASFHQRCTTSEPRKAPEAALPRSSSSRQLPRGQADSAAPRPHGRRQGRVAEAAPLSPARQQATSEQPEPLPPPLSSPRTPLRGDEGRKEGGRERGREPSQLREASQPGIGQRCRPRGSGQPRFGQRPGRAQSPPRGTVCPSVLSRGPRPRPGSSYCPGSAPGTSPPPSWDPTHWRFRQEPDTGAPSPPEIARAMPAKPLPPFFPIVSASLLWTFGAAVGGGMLPLCPLLAERWPEGCCTGLRRRELPCATGKRLHPSSPC